VNGVARIAHALPGAEEERMIRAIARSTVFEAVRHGEGRASFLGYDIEAMRLGTDRAGYPRVEVTLRAAASGRLLERGVFVVEIETAH
jgi:hypothetical protein